MNVGNSLLGRQSRDTPRVYDGDRLQTDETRAKDTFPDGHQEAF
jgi:hypothetical protein